MRSIWLILLTATLLSSIGCYSNPSYQREIAILRGEIIDLENKYYSIKSHYEATQAELDRCRGIDPEKRPNRTEEIFGNPNQGVEPLPKIEDQGDDSNPLIEDDSSGDDSSGGGNENSENDDGFLTGPINQNFGVSNQTRSQPHTWVKDIRLDRQLTRAQNFDGQDGDDGVLLVVQPMDEEGNIIPVAGKMTVSIIDSREKGPRQRIGFYEMTQQELTPMVETSDALGAGIHVRLNWNRNLPRNRMVRIFVRFETEDGKRFEASLPVRVNTTQDQADQWTQNSGQPQRVPASNASSTRRPRWQPRRR